MSLASLATATAYTKRPTMAGGARTQQNYLLDLQCTPFYPATYARTGELQQALKLQTLGRLWECYVLGVQDIQAGDYLIASGASYLVRAVAPFAHGPESFSEVTVEEQLTSE